MEGIVSVGRGESRGRATGFSILADKVPPSEQQGHLTRPDTTLKSTCQMRTLAITNAIGMIMNKELALDAGLRANGASDRIQIVVE